MFTIHNAVFCCPDFRDKLLSGKDIQHECTKTPAYVVDAPKEVKKDD
jgi:hypothetical protein